MLEILQLLAVFAIIGAFIYLLVLSGSYEKYNNFGEPPKSDF